MRQNVVLKFNTFAAGLLGLAIAASVAGCNKGAATQSRSTAGADSAAAVDATREAELQARSQQLAQRETELAAREQEQERTRQLAAEAAQRQREVAAKSAAAKKAALARSTPVPNARSASVDSERSRPARRSADPIEVPAGTQLTVALSSDLSTKTGKPGDAFEARLVSDLVIDGRRLAAAGSRVTGTITEVISGSNSIGAIPKLALKFDNLELTGGRQIPISSELVQEGQSEKGRDTAKILGGAAAGAIIGHQVKNNDTGTVIGGLLGGAAGAVVAKKTGTEVQLAAGSTLTITLNEAFKVASI
jgi:hypothetical protein